MDFITGAAMLKAAFGTCTENQQLQIREGQYP
jgi:hypothetical protein